MQDSYYIRDLRFNRHAVSNVMKHWDFLAQLMDPRESGLASIASAMGFGGAYVGMQKAMEDTFDCNDSRRFTESIEAMIANFDRLKNGYLQPPQGASKGQSYPKENAQELDAIYAADRWAYSFNTVMNARDQEPHYISALLKYLNCGNRTTTINGPYPDLVFFNKSKGGRKVLDYLIEMISRLPAGEIRILSDIDNGQVRLYCIDPNLQGSDDSPAGREKIRQYIGEQKRVSFQSKRVSDSFFLLS